MHAIHARDAKGKPSLDPDIFERTHQLITERTDMIVQISTGARASYDTDARSAAVKRVRPEMASLTTGSMNFPDQVYANSFDVVETLATVMKETGTKPEEDFLQELASHSQRYA